MTPSSRNPVRPVVTASALAATLALVALLGT